MSTVPTDCRVCVLDDVRVPDTTDKSDSERISQQKLKLLCDTKWVERHTTFEDQLALYEPLGSNGRHC